MKHACHSAGHIETLQRPIHPQPQLQLQEDGLISGYDSPRKFATEDTPLNYSATGSLSDLSLDSHTGDGAENVESANARNVGARQMEDTKSDVSLGLSDDDDDEEDLLSEAIQSALPKKKSASQKKLMPMDRRAEGSESTRIQYKSAFRPPVAPPACTTQSQAMHMYKQQPLDQMTYNIPRSEHDVDGASQYDDDTVQTYAVEDTPINFSRATSLGDLSTIDIASDRGKDLNDEQGTTQSTATVSSAADFGGHLPSSLMDAAALTPVTGGTQDSSTVFDVEGTPMSFSRDESLSPLLCEDDVVIAAGGGLHSPGLTPKKSDPSDDASSPRVKLFTGRKPGIQSPAITRLKTTGRHHLRMPNEPNLHSTPMMKGHAVPQQSLENHSEDQVTGYAVEGTPSCFSQNSSLSSLDSDEHESLANRSGGSSGSGRSRAPKRS